MNEDHFARLHGRGPIRQTGLIGMRGIAGHLMRLSMDGTGAPVQRHITARLLTIPQQITTRRVCRLISDQQNIGGWIRQSYGQFRNRSTNSGNANDLLIGHPSRLLDRDLQQRLISHGFSQFGIIMGHLALHGQHARQDGMIGIVWIELFTDLVFQGGQARFHGLLRRFAIPDHVADQHNNQGHDRTEQRDN